MRFNQFVPDTQYNRNLIRTVEVNIDDVRMNDEYENKVRMFASCDNMSCVMEPGENYFRIIDNKRTFRMKHFKQAMVIKHESNYIEVDCFEDLCINLFDPVALFSENKSQYGYVSEIQGNKIQIVDYKGTNLEVEPGNFLQNLNGAEKKPVSNMGVLAALSRPEQPSFTIENSSFSILVAIVPPQNKFRCQFYDIYVRDKFFSEINNYWFPDVYDKPLADEYSEIKTYSGYKSLEFGKSYYLSVVGKDKKGFKNTNESLTNSVQVVHYG